jgi:hypothetical protein
MYSISFATIFLYIASVLFFLLGVQYKEFFTAGFSIGALLFLVATGTLIVILRKRMEKQNF